MDDLRPAANAAETLAGRATSGSLPPRRQARLSATCMSRATLLYIVTLVACAAGLWLVLRTGTGLVPPTDLSGVWFVGGEDPAQPEVLGETLYIEQSGRYVRLNFEQGLIIDLTMVSERRPDPGTGDGLDLELKGPLWSLSAHGTGADGPLIFHLEDLKGPVAHRFTARRDPVMTEPDELVGHDAAAAVAADVGADAP